MRGPSRSVLGRLFLILACALSLALPASVRADPISELRQRATELQVEEEGLVLEIYGLDSRIEQAQARVDRVRARLATIRSEQEATRLRLGVARRTLRISQASLAATLHALYVEGGENDPLAVLLGAESFDDIVDGLDSLTRAAREHAYVAEQARVARAKIRRFARSLKRRAAEVAQLEAEAVDAADALADARAQKTAYLSQVRSDQAATAEEITTAEAEAAAARARAEALAAQPPVSVASFASAAAATAPATEEAEPEAPAAEEPAAEEPVEEEPVPEAEPLEPAPTQAPPSGARTMTVNATAYSGGGTTATGIPVGWGVVAVDPSVIPLGTRMTIPGYGEGVAADTGSAVIGAMIDVWVPTEAQADAWGVKTIEITLH